MAEDFWGKIYAELHENEDFLRLVLIDTSEKDIISWIKPNPALNISCGRFIRKGCINDRQALEKAFFNYARQNQPLRKIILFNWVEKNPETMKLPSLALDEEIKKQIYKGIFGPPLKIRIMSHIDPRDGARSFYRTFLAEYPEVSATESVVAVAIPEQLSDDNVTAASEKRIQELETALKQVKTENKDLRKLLENRTSENSCQNKKLQEIQEQLRYAKEESDCLLRENSGLKSRLEFLQKLSDEIKPSNRDNSTTPEDVQETILELKHKISLVQKALDNRNSTIERLESEKADLRALIKEHEDKSSQVKNLQKMLENSNLSATETEEYVGQLLTIVKNDSGKIRWLFISTNGRHFYLLPEIVEKAHAVIDEYCLLSLDRQNNPVSLKALELSCK